LRKAEPAGDFDAEPKLLLHRGRVPEELLEELAA
jgi:hypothetical protein